MLTIQIPKDIREFETKFAGPLTLRQAVCCVVACAIEYAGVKLQSDILKLPVTSYIPPLFIAMIPLFFGFGEKALHMKPETYLRIVLFNMLMVPKHRPYKTKNYYDVYLTEPGEPMKKDAIPKGTTMPDELIAYK